MILADVPSTSEAPRIFDEQIARKPDRYPEAQKFMDAMWQSFWTPNEFNFNSDIQDFKTKLSAEEQGIIKNTLSAIGQIEIAVKTFWAKLGDNLPHPSLRDLGYCLANVEVIHNKAYEKLLDKLGLEDTFEENLKLDVIKGRVNYLRKYLKKQYSDSKKQYIYSLILFTLFVENVSLFSQFYTISWFGRYLNALKDTNQQVSYTRTEETTHAQVGIWLVNRIKEEYPELFDEDLEEKIYTEAREAFECESKIVAWMLGDYYHPNLNQEVLREYIKNRLNDSLEQIGFERIFDIDESVLEKTYWMDEEVLGNTATDFFFKKPTDYAKKNATFSADELF